jgi:hypothetical protein
MDNRKNVYFSKDQTLPDVRIKPPEGLFDSDDFNKETREDEEEEQYKFGRIWRDPTDKCYTQVKKLYDNFHHMTETELVSGAPISCFFNFVQKSFFVFFQV